VNLIFNLLYISKFPEILLKVIINYYVNIYAILYFKNNELKKFIIIIIYNKIR